MPTAYDSQLTLPVFENIRGTISAAVMVGEMSAMFCASSSTKFRQFALSFGSILSVVMARTPFTTWTDDRPGEGSPVRARGQDLLGASVTRDNAR